MTYRTPEERTFRWFSGFAFVLAVLALAFEIGVLVWVFMR